MVCRAAIWTIVGLVALVATTEAQRTARRATTLETIRRYPGFYHEQPVALLGTVARAGAAVRLVSGSSLLPLVGTQIPSEGTAEVRGVVYDIGRLNADDPRLTFLNLDPLLERSYRERWPKRGEALTLLITETVATSGTTATPSLRDLALDPQRYEGQRLILVGQFRGRNLYGELPNPPTGDPDGFVIRSSDGAVWVSGLKPEGRGFRFDAMHRDKGYTARWVRVTGVMHHGLGMPWMEGKQIELAEMSSAAALEDIMAASTSTAPVGPVQVLFTSPIEGERNVALGATIRMQFSDDLEPTSIDGRVLVTSIRPENGPGQAEKAVTVTLTYTPAIRGLAIDPKLPFEPFSGIRVRVLDGVRAANGARLPPFETTFTTGSR